MRGRELDARGLSTRLRKYEIKPKDLRLNGSVVKGYAREDFVGRLVQIPPRQVRYTRYTAPVGPVRRELHKPVRGLSSTT